MCSDIDAVTVCAIDVKRRRHRTVCRQNVVCEYLQLDLNKFPCACGQLYVVVGLATGNLLIVNMVLLGFRFQLHGNSTKQSHECSFCSVFLMQLTKYLLRE